MRWAGKIGVSQETDERPGIWEDVIIEFPKMGTVETRTETFREEGNVHATYANSTSVSVLSEGPEMVNYLGFKYITHLGIRWSIASIAYEYPRMVIYLGEEYHGPGPADTSGNLVDD